jgi:hypothetical protein
MPAGRSPHARPCGREAREGLMDAVGGGDGHAPRLASLPDGVDGGRHAARLGVRALGQGWAVAQGRAPHHAMTPVDRWRSPPTRSRAQVFDGWEPCVEGEWRALGVHVAGTVGRAADPGTGVRGRPPAPGRRTPLRGQPVPRAARQDPRHDPEADRRVGCASVLPQSVRGTVGG